MQGRLGLPVSKCIEAYKTLGEKIFSRPRLFHVLSSSYLRSKYDSDDFEEILINFLHQADNRSDNRSRGRSCWHYPKKFVKTRAKRIKKKIGIGSSNVDSKEIENCHNGGLSFRQEHDKPCKTVAVATKHADSCPEPHLFRSYDHERGDRHRGLAINNSGKACEASIVQVVRATSAAPGFFKVVKIANDKIQPGVQDERCSRFMDGGVLYNNPSDLAWNEVCAWQIGVSGRSTGDAIGCFVSIGCGRSKWQIFGNKGEIPLLKYIRMIRAPRKMVIDTNPPHYRILSLARLHHVPYYRFTVYEGLEDTELDEWTTKKRKIGEEELNGGQKMDTFTYIREVTKRYLEGKNNRDSTCGEPERPVHNELEECARLLVEYRIARMGILDTNGFPNG
ncbi:MAG: hypothetical protein M1840_007519 [Geoglossum simile]|nr:MAG: hypothetical protein M1840_007519 [Geoglossum simile]